jgi:hypothetical protein
VRARCRRRACLGRTFDERRRSTLNLPQRLTVKDPFPTHGTLVESQRGHDIGLAAIGTGPITANLFDLVAATRWAVRNVQFHGLHKAFLEEIRK